MTCSRSSWRAASEERVNNQGEMMQNTDFLRYMRLMARFGWGWWYERPQVEA